jgi:hypothetical protein
VELGKQLATTVQRELEGGELAGAHDASTLGLLRCYREVIED